MTQPNPRPRRVGRSIGAVAVGLLLVVAASTLTDIVLHAVGVFPPWGQPMADALFVLAIVYRALYTILGGFVAARLAPRRPMAHAAVLGLVGLVLGIVGAVATAGRGPAFGPPWYALALVLIALPACLLGGYLHRLRRRAGGDLSG